MKKTTLIYAFAALLTAVAHPGLANFSGEKEPPASGEYTLIVEGFDWGADASKVVLLLNETVKAASADDYAVFATRKTDMGQIAADQASGQRQVISAYVSDASGQRAESGQFVTLVLYVAPNRAIGSPIQYLRIDNQGRNYWIEYQLSIINTVTGEVWNTEKNRIRPLVDRFDVSGKYRHNDQLTMSYAAYTPADKAAKAPLIIWLHGGGEGGTDASIPLIANRAANYASDEIQSFFGGAYVLAPQCPGAWMHNAEGVTTHGRENDIYNERLMALIRDFVKSHPDIDPKRIYVGGCSNGGYMALKLILLYPTYFAAGYISALAYKSQYVTDQQIQSIKDVPTWFVHSKDDPVTIADQTVVPVYNRLMAAGARNVHFSYFDHVTDITGLLGGDGHHYNGHWSWIYMHANKCRLDFNGKPVMVKGRSATIMEWMAAQSR